MRNRDGRRKKGRKALKRHMISFKYPNILLSGLLVELVKGLNPVQFDVARNETKYGNWARRALRA